MTVLVIAEKPKASTRIANALAEGEIIQKKNGKTFWYEIYRKGEKHLVVPAVGHLFTLKQKGSGGWTYPIFESEWAPSFKVSRSSAFSGRSRRKDSLIR